MLKPNAVVFASAFATALLIAAAPTLSGAAADVPRAGPGERKDFEVVECLLPPQVRSLGRGMHLWPRQPTRTTAADCRIRGGEYVAFDRADYRTALNVWLETANAGDKEAQANVGEIYEKGLGTDPNYEIAALWYKKAADQGLPRALTNLGLLYEQGLGVPQDRLQALNLYRQAAGVKESNLLFEETRDREVEAIRTELTKTIAEKDSQIDALQQQVESLDRQLSKEAGRSQSSAQQIQALSALVASLKQSREADKQKLGALPNSIIRSPVAASTGPVSPVLPVTTVAGLNLGRYYALVIGNQDYVDPAVGDLQTPLNDADRAAKVLQDRYGFTVRTLKDANDVAMMSALNDLFSTLKPNDNLLIYYAGHGSRLPTGKTEAGYWLPVNAEAPPRNTFWVANEQVTGHIGRLNAKRVLIVADSCYAGLLSANPNINFLSDPGRTSLDYLRFALPSRARLLIASGGDQPVLDAGSAGNSVFARAFLDVLESNQGVLSAPSLYAQIRDRVQIAASRAGFTQRPEFKTIKGAGHELGDFFFVPRVGR